jgi:hypothetical protein
MRFKNITKSILAGLTFMSAVSAHAVLSKDLKVAAAELQKAALSQDLTPATCAAQLKMMADELYNLPPDYFTNDLDVKETADGSDALSQLFKTRLELTQRFKQMVVTGGFKDSTELEDCATRLRIALRNIRELEDVTGLNLLNKAGKTPAALSRTPVPYPMVDQSWPNLLMNREIYGNKKLDKTMIKSGDIFLVKGVMFPASPISRVSKVDNQFTHIAVAYVDDGSLFGPQNKGNVYFINAEPDFGVEIVGFDFFVKDRKARLLHYRYSESNGDAERSARLAAEAAKYVAAMSVPRVNPKDLTDLTLADRLLATNNNLPPLVPYNFSMDLAKKDALFCSQVVSFAFDHICENQACETYPKYIPEGKSAIPLSVSKFDVENNSLAQLLELKKPEIFSPADIEIDPRFQLLSEWRDYSVISESRIIDMTNTKIFQYIENQKYTFLINDSLNIMANIGNKVAKGARILPEYTPDGYAKGTMMMTFLIKYTGPGQMIVDQIPNLPSDKVAQIMMDQGVPAEMANKVARDGKSTLTRILNHVSITTRITNLNEQNLKVKGRYLTAKQMDFAIDQIRNKDCERYIKGENPVMIHDFFRRTNSNMKSEQCDMKNTPLTDLVYW